MIHPSLEERIELLEREFAVIKRDIQAARGNRSWQDTFGMFAKDPDFDEILRLGREYREQENRKASP